MSVTWELSTNFLLWYLRLVEGIFLLGEGALWASATLKDTPLASSCWYDQPCYTLASCQRQAPSILQTIKWGLELMTPSPPSENPQIMSPSQNQLRNNGGAQLRLSRTAPQKKNELSQICKYNFSISSCNPPLRQVVILQLGKHRNVHHKICWVQIPYVCLLLPHVSETHLTELSFTHSISIKYYPFWFQSIIGLIKEQQMLLHNSLHIFNDLDSGRLQTDLNVVFKCLWIMSCTHL